MQIRYPIELTITEYREQRAWENAKLDRCPFHPEGGCGVTKHGTYPRKFPEFCLVPRWYCPTEGQSISQLPDFFASRLPGTLDEVEQAVNIVQGCSSQEAAAEALRPDIGLPGALRWLRRRLGYVRQILTILAGLLATGCAPDLQAFQQKYATTGVLTNLRRIAEAQLACLPPIVGFGPRLGGRYCCRLPPNNRRGLSMAG